MPEKRIRHYRQVVDRVEHLVWGGLIDSYRVTHLCRVAGVSQRLLRRAFQQIHGISPCRYIHALRLNRARKALLSPDSASVTVTQVATGCGFLELGRFSVEYRLVFGESPSVTLRKALTSRESAAARAENSMAFKHSQHATLDNYPA